MDKIVGEVTDLFEMQIEEILQPSKVPQYVKARSLVCYWAVRQPSIDGTTICKKLGLTQSAASKAVRRLDKMVLDKDYSLELYTNSKFMDIKSTPFDTGLGDPQVRLEEHHIAPHLGYVSTTLIRAPSDTSSSTMYDLMNPHPPVTRALMFLR